MTTTKITCTKGGNPIKNLQRPTQQSQNYGKTKKLNPTPDYTRVVQNRFDIWSFAVLDFSPGSTKAHENMTSISPHIHMLSLNMRVIL